MIKMSIDTGKNINETREKQPVKVPLNHRFMSELERNYVPPSRFFTIEHKLLDRIKDHKEINYGWDYFEAIEKKVLPLLKKENRKTPFGKQVWKKIDESAERSMKEGNMGWVKRKITWLWLKKQMFGHADNNETIQQIETSLRQIISRNVSQKEVKDRALRRRALSIYNRVIPDIMGDTVLDYGSGDCFIAEHVKTHGNKKVLAYDIVNLSRSNIVKPKIVTENELDLDNNSVDTTLLIAVLHHAIDPIRVLEEAIRVTKKRIIVLEGDVNTPLKYAFNSFFDWLFGRALRDPPESIPLNYLKDEAWEQLFNQYSLRIVKKEYTGIDVPLTPEYHLYYVLEKK